MLNSVVFITVVVTGSFFKRVHVHISCYYPNLKVDEWMNSLIKNIHLVVGVTIFVEIVWVFTVTVSAKCGR